MQTLGSWVELQRIIALVDRRSPNFSTNIFATAEQFANWQQPVRAFIAEGAVLVAYPDVSFLRLAHAATSAAALTAALSKLPQATYIADVIGNEAELSTVTRAYEAAGFSRHATLARMSRTQVPAPVTDPHPAEDREGSQSFVTTATAEDAAAIARMLGRQLDPWAERVPKRDDLALAASAGRLLVAKRDGCLTGMLMYEMKGALAHLQYWHVDKERLGQGSGGALMRAFLAQSSLARRIVLWVIGDNARSIAIYQRYGFAEDGLLDAILVLNEGTGP